MGKTYLYNGEYKKSLDSYNTYYSLIDLKSNYNMKLVPVYLLTKGTKHTVSLVARNETIFFRKIKNKKINWNKIIEVIYWYSVLGEDEKILKIIDKIETYLSSRKKSLLSSDIMPIILFYKYYSLISINDYKNAAKIKAKILKNFTNLVNKRPKRNLGSDDLSKFNLLATNLWMYNDLLPLYRKLLIHNNSAFLEYVNALLKTRKIEKVLILYDDLMKEKSKSVTSKYKRKSIIYNILYANSQIGDYKSIDKYFRNKYNLPHCNINKVYIKLAQEDPCLFFSIGVYRLGEKKEFTLISKLLDHNNYDTIFLKKECIRANIKFNLYWNDNPSAAKKLLKKLKNLSPFEYDFNFWDYKYYIHKGNLKKTYDKLFDNHLKPNLWQRDYALVGDLCLYYLNFKIQKVKHIDSLLLFSDSLIDERIFMFKIAILAESNIEDAKNFIKKYKDSIIKMPYGNLAVTIGKYLIGQATEKEIFAIKANTLSQKNYKNIYGNFYIGQKLYNAGKKKQASKYFSNIFKQRYLGFYVVGVARHLLVKCDIDVVDQEAEVTKKHKK